MTDYLRCLAAYLTGWVIAQSALTRVRRYVQERDGLHDVKDEIASYVADRLVTRLDNREKETKHLRTVCHAAELVLSAESQLAHDAALTRLSIAVQNASVARVLGGARAQ